MHTPARTAATPSRSCSRSRDNSLTSCPECQGTLRKKFNSVGVVFKGSGFYRTDSRDAKGSTVSPAPAAPAATPAPAAARQLRHLPGWRRPPAGPRPADPGHCPALAPARCAVVHIGRSAAPAALRGSVAWRHGTFPHRGFPAFVQDGCPGGVLGRLPRLRSGRSAPHCLKRAPAAGPVPGSAPRAFLPPRFPPQAFRSGAGSVPRNPAGIRPAAVRRGAACAAG